MSAAPAALAPASRQPRTVRSHITNRAARQVRALLKQLSPDDQERLLEELVQPLTQPSLVSSHARRRLFRYAALSHHAGIRVCYRHDADDNRVIVDVSTHDNSFQFSNFIRRPVLGIPIEESEIMRQRHTDSNTYQVVPKNSPACTPAAEIRPAGYGSGDEAMLVEGFKALVGSVVRPETSALVELLAQEKKDMLDRLGPLEARIEKAARAASLSDEAALGTQHRVDGLAVRLTAHEETLTTALSSLDGRLAPLAEVAAKQHERLADVEANLLQATTAWAQQVESLSCGVNERLVTVESAVGEFGSRLASHQSDVSAALGALGGRLSVLQAEMTARLDGIDLGELSDRLTRLEGHAAEQAALGSNLQRAIVAEQTALLESNRATRRVLTEMHERMGALAASVAALEEAERSRKAIFSRRFASVCRWFRQWCRVRPQPGHAA